MQFLKRSRVHQKGYFWWIHLMMLSLICMAIYSSCKLTFNSYWFLFHWKSPNSSILIVQCIHFNFLTRESRTNIWLPWHWIMDENLINTLHVPISWCTIIHISFHFLNNISYFNYVSDCHWFGSLYVSVRPAFYYLAFFFESSVKMHSNIWILFPFCWLQSWIFIQNKLYSNISSFRTRTSLKKILLIYDFYFLSGWDSCYFPLELVVIL